MVMQIGTDLSYGIWPHLFAEYGLQLACFESEP